MVPADDADETARPERRGRARVRRDRHDVERYLPREDERGDRGTAELASIAYEAPSHEWRVDGAPTVSFPLGDGPATITPLFPLARGTDFLFLVFTSTTCVAQGDPRCP